MADTPRQVVVCCDGTNNTLTGGANDTNVVRVHDLLATCTPEGGFERVLYYDPGVGSPGMLPPVGAWEWLNRQRERLEGLASGSGVFDNIAAGYVFLMRNWRGHEDRIYLFGFSRGAFTVRAVAGMVNLFGVVRPEYESLVPTLVYLYFSPVENGSRSSALQRIVGNVHENLVREPAAQADPSADVAPPDRKELAAQVRAKFAGPVREEAWVHFVGVWDTVESVGLPGPLSRVNPTPPTVVGKRYLHIRHALTLDEHRWAFLPRLYEEPGDVDHPVTHPASSIGATTQTLRQRWYPGGHGDAGGGYAPAGSGVAEAALRWMILEAPAELGMHQPPPLASATGQPASALRHDSLYDTPYWALAGMTVRRMDSYEGPRGMRMPFTAIAAPNTPPEPIASVWSTPRPLGPVFLALVAGLFSLVASGLCLQADRSTAWNDFASIGRSITVASDFARLQLEALWGRGLIDPVLRPWVGKWQPGWAMFWDLVFVACWGYLLARIASRAFTWMVGWRSARSTRPAWLFLGFMPMLAVGGDVAEDLLLWLSLVLHVLGTDGLAVVALWFGGVASLAKLAGLAGCIPLLLVRLGIVISPRAPWHAQQAPAASVAPA